MTTPVQTIEPSRCRKCGSTERTKYTNRQEQEYAGIDPKGQEYTHIIRHNTRCKTCGQMRIDRTYENRIPSLSDGNSEKTDA